MFVFLVPSARGKASGSQPGRPVRRPQRLTPCANLVRRPLPAGVLLNGLRGTPPYDSTCSASDGLAPTGLTPDGLWCRVATVAGTARVLVLRGQKGFRSKEFAVPGALAPARGKSTIRDCRNVEGVFVRRSGHASGSSGVHRPCDPGSVSIFVFEAFKPRRCFGAGPRRKKRLKCCPMISWLLYPLICSPAFQNLCKVLTASDHRFQARDHLAQQYLRD